MDAVLTELLHQGPFGVTAIIFIYLFLKKDQELAEERRARIDDSKSSLTLALDLQQKMLVAIEKVGTISELAMNRDRERGIK